MTANRDLRRAALQKLWEKKAKHGQAIADLKAAILADGTSPYDKPASASPDEARQYVKRALRGTWRR